MYVMCMCNIELLIFIIILEHILYNVYEIIVNILLNLKGVHAGRFYLPYFAKEQRRLRV